MESFRPDAPSLLEEISTRWPLISDPLQFVLRYAPAMQRYLSALIKDPHDAEDVAQSFLARIVDEPFTPDRIGGGRFRDYLKAVLRNAAFSHFRRRARLPGKSANLEYVPAPETESAAEQAWMAEWRECLLKRAWDALEQHERQAPDGLAYTALRLTVDYPGEDSTALAARATKLTGHAIRADAFRKQLSRARRHFAGFIVDAVKQTLERPKAEDVLEELSTLGLMEYVKDFLPKTIR